MGADSEPRRASGAVDRREALRRTAAFGGALLWTTPVVQTIAMRAAAAGTRVPAACMSHLDLKVRYQESVYCLKFPEEDFICGGTPPTTETTFVSHPATGAGGSDHCLSLGDCTPGPAPVAITASSLDGGATWTVQLPEGVELIEGFSKGCPGGDCVSTTCPPGTVGPVGCVFSC